MAAHPIVVIHDGKVQIPEEVHDDPRFQNGATLQLVPVAAMAVSDLPAPKGDWRRLEGILAREGETFSATEWKREERERELAHDERKFGVKRPSW
jgi:hypothetical protein